MRYGIAGSNHVLLTCGKIADCPFPSKINESVNRLLEERMEMVNFLSDEKQTTAKRKQTNKQTKNTNGAGSSWDAFYAFHTVALNNALFCCLVQ